MTDEEMIALCAKAVGYLTRAGATRVGQFFDPELGEWIIYNPLKNEAQAMELVKKFDLNIDKRIGGIWVVWPSESRAYRDVSTDLNRAIVGCVAKMTAHRQRSG